MSKTIRFIFSLLLCLGLGGSSFFGLLNWFNIGSFASKLGYITAFYILIVTTVSVIKTRSWMPNHKMTPHEAKGATLIFRLISIPFMFMLLFVLAIYRSGNGTMEAILSFSSLLFGGCGLIIALLFIFNRKRLLY